MYKDCLHIRRERSFSFSSLKQNSINQREQNTHSVTISLPLHKWKKGKQKRCQNKAPGDTACRSLRAHIRCILMNAERRQRQRHHHQQQCPQTTATTNKRQERLARKTLATLLEFVSGCSVYSTYHSYPHTCFWNKIETNWKNAKRK